MHHLGLYAQCGICADMIFRHERVIALFGNDDSTSYRGQTRAFLFPENEPTMTMVNGFRLCRYPNCQKCAASPQFIPIHYECFHIFQQCCGNVDALDQLWTAAAWRSPWSRARPIYLSASQPDTISLEALARACQLPQLCELPVELLSMVKGYSEHALLWRAITAHSLAARISTETQAPLLIMSLDDISYWKRGGKPEKDCEDSLSHMTRVRLTIDSDGISKIEHMPDQPSKEVYSVSSAYIVERKQTIAKCSVQLKNGRLRLILPTGQPPPRIWNTPNPPELNFCNPYIRGYNPSWQRFFAVDTGRISGITFFFSSNRLLSIYPHYSNTSDAMATYRRFSYRRKRDIVWVYQPISKHDRLLVLGVRESPLGKFSILVRFERAGDVVIGSYIPGPATQDRCLGQRPPMTLIYNEPIEGQEVSFLCVYSGLTSRVALPKHFAMEKLRSIPNSLAEDAYLSKAPLADVASAKVFYEEDTKLCKGIIFRYHDGVSRAVGQCRVNVDATNLVSWPLRFCYRINEACDRYHQVTHSVQVTLQEEPHRQHGEEWNCHKLDGMLNFWFTPESSFITIET
ncbi:hypothetical protein F4774DRAFT_388568 [Daldinia eschscholtzii]|nr:hypothetical protein F4774DRAFT_388568 [Daldinia eschscholtzii]